MKTSTLSHLYRSTGDREYLCFAGGGHWNGSLDSRLVEAFREPITRDLAKKSMRYQSKHAQTLSFTGIAAAKLALNAIIGASESAAGVVVAEAQMTSDAGKCLGWR